MNIENVLNRSHVFHKVISIESKVDMKVSLQPPFPLSTGGMYNITCKYRSRFHVMLYVRSVKLKLPIYLNFFNIVSQMMNIRDMRFPCVPKSLNRSIITSR